MKDEQEESLIILQFTDIDDANYTQQFSHNFKTINIDEKNPIIQIGSRFYKGEYTNNGGTYLFFEQNKLKSEEIKNSPDFPHSDYSGKSFKKLILNRLFIEEKKD